MRHATPEDGARVAQIRVQSWQDAYRHILPADALAAMRPEPAVAHWSGFAQAEPPTRLFVAVDDDDVPVAYCLVGAAREEVDRHADLPTGELWAIYADPAVVGTGAGNVLHEMGIDHLVRNGFKHAVLWVLEGNEAAMRFYRARGWRPDGGQAGFEWGGTQVSEVRYARSLP